MIFISHTFKDKPIVEPFAIGLANVYGNDNVFYDSWSIQPGDGIIDKMNSGLTDSNIFFFFISENSLQSKMVQLEWQNALMDSVKGNIKFIPVRLDKCTLPIIMKQTLFLDVFTNGVDVVLRQMIDVIEGRNTFSGENKKFENVKAKIQFVNSKRILIEIFAEYYMEPISKYGIVVMNKENAVTIKCLSDTLFMQGFTESGATITNDSGTIKANMIGINVSRATTPGFPVRIELVSNTDEDIQFLGIVKANTEDSSSGMTCFLSNDLERFLFKEQ